MNNDMTDFSIFKFYDIGTKLRKEARPIQVI